ncbi:STAS domain-containing protein [Marivita sp. GX14005]|uniref:STAS domain-containing protein n=1 Tax=Marivita sp. GX14005 TaxID=2942276 RepID=UPI0020195482|nr:STAS domain-containing protein [Marivita sp. GX14005]MCL3881853.1 STAS domain-containing protein [Marivita sp. GX14005]
MELTTHTAPHATIIRVQAARIDAPVALDFKEEMRTLTHAGKGRFILDLAQVEFIDSSGLGAVVAAMKQLRPHQSLELAELQPIVAKVFRLTRMDTVFTIHDSADIAGDENRE